MLEATRFIGELLKQFQDNFGYSVKCSGKMTPKMFFRGVEDREYDLIPKLFRFEENLEQVLRRFTDMKFLNPSEMPKGATHDFDNLALLEQAQHYGVPTPLLDFTSNILVSLFFACGGFTTIKNTDGAIWLLDIDKFIDQSKLDIDDVYPHGGKVQNYLNHNAIYHIYGIDEFENGVINVEPLNTTKYPILYKPWYRERRMLSQSSWFLIWGTVKKPLNKQIGFNEYEYNETKGISESVNKNSALTKVVFPFGIKEQILMILDNTFGINIASIAPTLDNVGQYIAKKYVVEKETKKYGQIFGGNEIHNRF